MLCRLVVVLLVLSAPVGARVAAAAQEMASGIFLVAAPGLQDPNFSETVVLVTHPERGVPLGVIINRPLEHKLSELFPEHSGLKSRSDTIFMGGPVSRYGLTFLVRATEGPPQSIAVLRDVHLTGDADWVNERVERGELAGGLRAYAGYSGWGPGQLQNEIRRGDWYLLPADADAIFSRDPTALWPELSRRAALRRTRLHPAARRDQPL